MAKQVEVKVQPELVELPKEPLANDTAAKSLYVSVDTFNDEGRTVGERIVDMYHFGTQGWLTKHMWWAMHNKHTVELNTASAEDVGAYMFKKELELKAKYSPSKETVAA